MYVFYTILFRFVSTNSDSNSDSSSPPLAGVLVSAFSVVVLLAAIAYAVILAVVDWAAVGLMAYPADAVAPFAVISGAVLTIAIIVPHSWRFSFETFTAVLREEGLLATGRDPRTACTLLGIGDIGFPGALAAGCSAISTASVTVGGISIPIGGGPIALGTALALGVLFIVEPDRKLAALVVAVPEALAGLGCSLAFGWVPVEHFIPG